MKDLYHNSQAQRFRILKRLQLGSCTTIQLRHEEDILGVAPRIYELRHIYDYNIRTHWTISTNPGGTQHRVAQYILLPGVWRKEKKL